MSWLLIVIIAHFLNAINFIIDKLLLSKFVRSPIVYAFIIGILGILVVALVPFGFTWPGYTALAWDFLTGIFFIFALLLFFSALQIGETSRVVPLLGGCIPVFTLVLSYIFLGERLAPKEYLAFVFLVIGSVVITLNKTSSAKKKELIRKGYIYTLLSALFFAVSFSLTKYTYEHQPLITAFVLTRVGSFITVLFFLFWPKNRANIKLIFKGVPFKIKASFLSNQLLGALAFMLLNYAISLSRVSLINALQGVQYLFIIGFMIYLVKKYPKLFKEAINLKIILQKGAAVLAIFIGLFMLAY